MTKLMYISTTVLDELSENIDENLMRYRDGDFADLIKKGGWSIETSLDVDFRNLEDLEPENTPHAEQKNSLLVWRVLSELPHAMACERRIWTRLCHVEGLHYARTRWLNDKKMASSIRTHFFVNGQNGYIHDNAISRLWWNARIAKTLSPFDLGGALSLMLYNANVRKDLFERSRMFRRPSVGAAIVRILKKDDWLFGGQNNANISEFMKTLNRRGAGMLFETLPNSNIDEFMSRCLSEAKELAGD